MRCPRPSSCSSRLRRRDPSPAYWASKAPAARRPSVSAGGRITGWNGDSRRLRNRRHRFLGHFWRWSCFGFHDGLILPQSASWVSWLDHPPLSSPRRPCNLVEVFAFIGVASCRLKAEADHAPLSNGSLMVVVAFYNPGADGRRRRLIRLLFGSTTMSGGGHQVGVC